MNRNHVIRVSYCLFSLIIIRCAISSFIFFFTCTWYSDIKVFYSLPFPHAWDNFRTWEELQCLPINITRLVLWFCGSVIHEAVNVSSFFFGFFDEIFIILIRERESRRILWLEIKYDSTPSTRYRTWPHELRIDRGLRDIRKAVAHIWRNLHDISSIH